KECDGDINNAEDAAERRGFHWQVRVSSMIPCGVSTACYRLTVRTPPLAARWRALTASLSEIGTVFARAETVHRPRPNTMARKWTSLWTVKWSTIAGTQKKKWAAPGIRRARPPT